jgi:hypothetical protein
MKLSSVQAKHVAKQAECRVIPARHSITPKLRQAFGDHTFFANSKGLCIVEPAVADSGVGNIVKVASWTDNAHTILEPVRPEVTPVAVQLDPSADRAPLDSPDDGLDSADEMFSAENGYAAEDEMDADAEDEPPR